MVDVAAQEAVEGRRGKELDFVAAIVAAREAGLAGAADGVRLDGDAVAGLQRRDGGVHGEDCAGGLVAEDLVGFDDHGANAPGVPEVDIGAVGESRVSFGELCRGVEDANPHIPVLLMLIVTSPGWRLSPFCTDSSVGWASAIQRSCPGLV